MLLDLLQLALLVAGLAILCAGIRHDFDEVAPSTRTRVGEARALRAVADLEERLEPRRVRDTTDEAHEAEQPDEPPTYAETVGRLQDEQTPSRGQAPAHLAAPTSRPREART